MNYQGMSVEILELFVEASYRGRWPQRPTLRWKNRRLAAARKKRYMRRIVQELRTGNIARRAIIMEAIRTGGPNVTRDVCSACGGPIERREGTSNVFHVGARPQVCRPPGSPVTSSS